MVHALAVKEGVCVRPVLRRVTDVTTGDTTVVAIRCGSTREAKCPPCATLARRLRMTQCVEGWHRDDEPDAPAPVTTEGDDDVEQVDVPAAGDGAGERRVRSTRRRMDAPDLPRVPVEARTIGRTFTAPSGVTYRPSMFVTLTLPSYGKVIPGRGVPVDPARYDYRRAALDALHFSKLVDRWVQNLRRGAGYQVQHFAAVEPQRRLAPHLHTALRGAIPRTTIRAVTRGTYHQLWWPPFSDDDVVYDRRHPVWEPETALYVDPDTGLPLPSWAHALDELDADRDARPAHVMRFGTQVDIKGIDGASPDADRAVRYLTKYLTKAVTDTYTDPEGEHVDVAYEAHIDRLHAQLRYLPCSPDCANWLRYGVQPQNPGPGLVAGHCPSKAHDREHLGLGGRRVLVSRKWSGKTLTEHRADRATVVRQVLEAAGIAALEAGRLSAEVLDHDGKPRFVWEDLPVGGRDWATVVAGSVMERRRWREQYEEAKRASDDEGPPVDNRSATTTAATHAA
ncbi:replication initiator [Cellulomonas aerilata]